MQDRKEVGTTAANTWRREVVVALSAGVVDLSEKKDAHKSCFVVKKVK